MIYSKVTYIVRVKKMDIVVLMVRIWLNFVNSWIIVRYKGIDVIIVVMVELRMVVLMWDIAVNVF